MADHPSTSTSTPDASMNDHSMETAATKGKGKATDVSRTSMEDEHDNSEESSDDETGAEDEVSPPLSHPSPKSPPLPSDAPTCLASFHSFKLAWAATSGLDHLLQKS